MLTQHLENGVDLISTILRSTPDYIEKTKGSHFQNLCAGTSSRFDIKNWKTTLKNWHEKLMKST